MQKLGIFYLILMVFFSIMPCSDESEIFTDATVITKSVEQKSANEESCSPICFCMCCGQQVLAPAEAKFELDLPLPNTHQLVFAYHLKPKQRAAAIWQPPKLG